MKETNPYAMHPRPFFTGVLISPGMYVHLMPLIHVPHRLPLFVRTLLSISSATTNEKKFFVR